MIPGPAKNILIAPLDWGLGHTTRCIPLIRQLIAAKCGVVFAGNDRQQTFLANIFPEISFRLLPGYEVKYSRGSLIVGLLGQTPRLFRKIRDEHEWLLALVREEKIDGIISDNRYGLWHPAIPSVILTHQAEIRTGFGRWADRLLRRLHYVFLRRFESCWIVDAAGAENLGGVLSHPTKLPRGARYIGWLSQFDKVCHPSLGKHLLILLSGPEPHRTTLSSILWGQVCALNMPVVFVEGSATAHRDNVPAHISYYPLLYGSALQTLLEDAKMVVCRSGYSTLMDLVLLQKRAILIPTPGQTEQEYLAGSLMKRGIFFAGSQKGFLLKKAIEDSKRFPVLMLQSVTVNQSFIKVLSEWISSL